MSEMIKIKTRQLVPPALDWAVAQAKGVEVVPVLGGAYGAPNSRYYCAKVVGGLPAGVWAPSTDDALTQVLIRDHVQVIGVHEGQVHAATHSGHGGSGDDFGIAVGRALVLSKLGDCVEVPAVLVAA